jgi:hypothetical protein
MASTPAEKAGERLRLGFQAAYSGQVDVARRNFVVTLRHDPGNIPALLWLAFLSATLDDSQRHLERVLVLEPGNERAQAGLRWVRQQRRQQALLPGEASAAPLPVTPSAAMVSTKPQTQNGGSGSQEWARPRAGMVLTLAVAMSVLLVGAMFLGVNPFRPATLLAALQPTDTPPATAVASPLPSPVVTLTPIPLPTDTPIPTPTVTTVFEPPAPTVSPIPPGPGQRPAGLRPGETKWIEVNVTTQQVTAWEHDVPVMTFRTSTGLANTPTVVGEFRIYVKLLSTRMSGPGYDLPNVPHTMYFYSGYALHGAYWHNNFGQPMSHGCVNLSPENAQLLFDWADPGLPSGTQTIHASADNPGTLVFVHY